MYGVPLRKGESEPPFALKIGLPIQPFLSCSLLCFPVITIVLCRFITRLILYSDNSEGQETTLTRLWFCRAMT